jgi:hypothetical protein
MESSGSRKCSVAGYCEYGTETTLYMKGRELHEQLRDSQLPLMTVLLGIS